MAFSISAIVPLTQVRARLSLLADQAKVGAHIEAERIRDAREAFVDVKHISRHLSVDVGSC